MKKQLVKIPRKPKILRKQKGPLAERYGSLKNSAGNAWDHMKKVFRFLFRLSQSLGKSRKEFQAGK